MPGSLIATWEWVQASDPGLSRLRMAASAAVAMATALGVELGFTKLIHANSESTVIAMLLGALVAMLGSMALTASGGGVRTKVLTAVFFPFAIGTGMLIGVAVGGHTDLMLGVFVIVMFVAVFVRRFGPAFFFYGFMLWLGYFFASFLGAKLAMMPFLIAAVALGSAWVLALSLTVLRVNPTRTLQRTVNAFDARARGVMRACAELLQSPRRGGLRMQRRLRRRVHGQERRLSEAALMVEAWAGEPAALPPGRSAAELRRQLIEAQQALDAIVTTTQALSDAGGEYCAAAGRIAGQLAYRDDSGAVRRARELKRLIKRQGSDRAETIAGNEARRPAYRFAKAALVFVSLARAARRLDTDADTSSENEADEFEPTAGMVMGNLPGSPAVASGLAARGAHWNPLARLDLTTRQAIQVAVAGGLAILAGRALSPTRYYWAVIAAFIMFTGTATRSETLLKGFNRVLGTALGLMAAVGLAELTAGHPIAIVVTIILSMFCGFYLIRVSYVCMIFFVTIMIAQLYTVFNAFTSGLLVLRLEETAIGAVLGFAIALFLMPLSTRDTVRSARREVLASLAEFLNAAAHRFEPDSGGKVVENELSADAGGEQPPTSLHALSRAFDDRIRRFTLVTKPLTRPFLSGGNSVTTRRRVTRYVAIATNVRALVVVLDELGSTDLDRNLAEAARALAVAATHLADAVPGRIGSSVADPLADAESALSDIEPIAAEDTPFDHAVQSLRRLLYLLKSLGTAS